MAILFSCPYCTASVKVPDSAAGKVGACPKCGTKIRIPTVEIPAQPAVAPPVHPAPAPGSGPIDLASTATLTAPVASAPVPPASNLVDPFDFSAAATSSSAAASHASTPTIATSSRNKKKPPRQPMNRGLLTAMGVGLLVLAAAGIWTYIQNLPVYEGAIAGARVPTGQAIAVTVPWAELDIPPQTHMPAIEYFKRHKTALTNNLLKIEIGATPPGLVVRFETTDDSILVSVDPQLIPDIKTLVTQNMPAWEQARKREQAQFARILCDNAAKAQAAGTRVENVSQYRDTVALNSLVRGLGRHCVVIANKTTHPCVFEDEQGLLYFVVPNQVSEILVIEKTGEGRVRALPEGFLIRASVPPSAAATPHLESTEEPEEEPPASKVSAGTEDAPAPTADETEKPATEAMDGAPAMTKEQE